MKKENLHGMQGQYKGHKLGKQTCTQIRINNPNQTPKSTDFIWQIGVKYMSENHVTEAVQFRTYKRSHFKIGKRGRDMEHAGPTPECDN